MTRDELREALARRLGYVYRKGHGWQDPEVHWGDRGTSTDPVVAHNVFAEKAVWLLVADECIRQMEWARHECCFEWAGTPDPITKAGSPDAILTAAPDDWRPDHV